MSKKSNNSKLEDKVSNNTYETEPNIYHLEALREDARDEIKRRIKLVSSGNKFDIIPNKQSKSITALFDIKKSPSSLRIGSLTR